MLVDNVAEAAVEAVAVFVQNHVVRVSEERTKEKVSEFDRKNRTERVENQ
jgi:hypothetical protein